jgi:hypothetical protein
VLVPGTDPQAATILQKPFNSFCVLLILDRIISVKAGVHRNSKACVIVTPSLNPRHSISFDTNTQSVVTLSSQGVQGITGVVVGNAVLQVVPS